VANPCDAQPGFDSTSSRELGQFGKQESMSTNARWMLIEIARMLGIAIRLGYCNGYRFGMDIQIPKS
jgi:hypothetical protein